MKKFQLHIVFFFPFNWNYYNNRIIFEDFKDNSVYNETFQYVYFFQISEKKVYKWPHHGFGSFAHQKKRQTFFDQYCVKKREENICMHIET
jgi:hypothetical protein